MAEFSSGPPDGFAEAPAVSSGPPDGFAEAGPLASKVPKPKRTIQQIALDSALSPEARDAEIAPLVGVDYDHIKISPQYQPGMLTAATNEPAPPGVAAAFVSPTFGARNQIAALANRGLNLVGAEDSSTVALNDALRTIEKQRLEGAAHKTNGLARFGAEMAGTMALPLKGSPFLQGAEAGALSQVEPQWQGNSSNFVGQTGLDALLGGAVGSGASMLARTGANAFARRFGSAETQAALSAPDNSLEALRNKLAARVPGGDASQATTNDLNQQFNQTKSDSRALWAKVRELGGGEPVSAPKAIDQVDAAIEELSHEADPPIGRINRLKALRDTLADGNQDLAALAQHRTDVGGWMSSAFDQSKQNGTDTRALQALGRKYRAIGQALDQDMSSGAARSGNQDFMDALDTARSHFKAEMVPWWDKGQGGDLLQKTMKTAEADRGFKDILQAGQDRAAIYAKQLGVEGKDAVRMGIVDAMWEASQKRPTEYTAGMGLPVPAQALNAAKKMQPMTDALFQGEDKAVMDGVMKVLKQANTAGVISQVGIGAGATMLPGGAALAALTGLGAGSMVGRGLGYTPAALWYKAMTSKPLRDTLLLAGKLPEGSSTLQDITNVLVPKSMAYEAASAANSRPPSSAGDFLQPGQ